MMYKLLDLAWELGGNLFLFSVLKIKLDKSVLLLCIFLVTAASSCSDQVGQTYISLQMKLQNGSEVVNQTMELTLPQFYDFLHQLEKTNNKIKQL